MEEGIPRKRERVDKCREVRNSMLELQLGKTQVRAGLNLVGTQCKLVTWCPFYRTCSALI